jgi:hypothetical protein
VKRLAAGAAILAVLLFFGATPSRGDDLTERARLPGLANDHAGRLLEPGAWGGEHAIVLASGDGTARFETDCGHGTIPGPLDIGAAGDFQWDGEYVPESGPSGGGSAHEAVYSGSVTASRMELSVAVPDIELAERFELEQGAAGVLVKCY